ncbi:Dolichyl-diphosphooligosaccharide--protein glycosyltransferase subunit STT3B [Trichinella pseudospiralis]|uniref:dolichyl-diphosphooligosaccharide--protein glycotransferase n=2 Tax=Trichinella pseudospiralis TaxID=6337 RepID=A0A0V0Y241_TRIPS|nr:Dolichyl-diphosphooligosaccharide--protein glycosyltransferase subunit STT3B [Trichinella pseudospiralis]
MLLQQLLFSGLTAIATFLLTKELWSHGAGLFAAAFMSIVPGYISRSVAGSYDNEGIAIFALQFTYFLWIRSVKTGSIFWSLLTALSYSYMVSAWGGYVFIINLIPLHIFILLLMGRFNSRMFIAYNVFFIMGLILSMQTPFVGFQPVRTSEHMAAMGVFILLNAYAAICFVYSLLSKQHAGYLMLILTLVFVFVGLNIIALLTYLGKNINLCSDNIDFSFLGVIAPWSGRFYSLWNTEYAKIHIPIISSVSEHQPTNWVAFFFDLHVLVASFPAGLWFCCKNMNDVRVFAILYSITAVYFAGVMIRLMLTLTPVVCVLAGITFSSIFKRYLYDEAAERTLMLHGLQRRKASHQDQSRSKDRTMYDKAGKLRKPLQLECAEAREQILSTCPDDDFGTLKTIIIATMLLLLSMFVVHCTWITSNAYSSPSVVLAYYNNDGSRTILDDFREAYFWLRKNTPDQARVMSWWDYGYQIAGMANRTTLVDNNTWNNSHIALVGKAMASTEREAYKIMRALDVDYVLVIFGGMIGYSGDDINKFLWMVRIAEGEHPKDIRENDYFNDEGDFRVDNAGSSVLLNCLMYKLSYYRFGDFQLDYRVPAGFDRARNTVIGNKKFNLEHLEEAFTSEHWLVRIYKVKKPRNIYSIPKSDRVFEHRRSKPYNKANNKGRGLLMNEGNAVKGRRSSRI